METRGGYLVDVDEGDKQKLIELSDSHFYNKSDFYEAIDSNKETVNKHLNNGDMKLALDTASKLAGIVNDSEPIYDLEDPFDEKYVERTTWAGEDRVKLDENYREFIFKTKRLNELQEITDASRDSLVNYRCRDRSIPEDVYLDVFNHIQEQFHTDLDIEVGLYANRKDLGIEGISLEEVRGLDKRIKQLRNLENNYPLRYGHIKNGTGLEQEIMNNLEKGLTTVKTDNQSQGHAAAILTDIGVLDDEKWAKAYEIEVNRDEFKVLMRELPKEETEKLEYYSDQELVEILQETFQDEKALKKKVRNSSDMPALNTFTNHFGSWTNALWRAGIDPNREFYGEEELADMTIKKWHRDGKVPNSNDIANDDALPTAQAIFNKFGSHEELIRKSSLETERAIQESNDQGYKYFVDDELEEDEEYADTDFEILF